MDAIEINPNIERAREYIERVGIGEARKSNHFLTAMRHCKCRTCFCCQVHKQVCERIEKGAQ